MHRKIVQHALGKDPAHIDSIVDRAIEGNHKFPWSFVNRALSGLDTAIWDLYGKIHQKPDKAIEVGKLIQDHGYYFFEEPCPYWELEWTAEVAKNLDMLVTGGEQDNDLAQWRRMIKMNAVDLIQPDILYLGGITRTLRAAKMAEQVGMKCILHSANVAMVSVFTLHVMGAIHNAGPFFELSIEPGGIAKQAAELYQPFLETKDGAVAIPDGPGWGVEFRQDWLSGADHQVSEA